MAVKKLGELLVESGLITEAQLKEALKESSDEKKGKLGGVLIKRGFATEIDIAQTLSYQLNIPFADTETASVDPEAVRLVDERLAQKYLLLPLCRDGKVLNVAMTDPLNLNAIDDIRFSTGLDVKPHVATHSDVTGGIARHYHLNEPIEDIIVDINKDRLIEVVHEPIGNADISESVKKSAAPPIIKMVDSIIIHGVEGRASDIHIEPQEKCVKLRVRVDGLMKEAMQLPKWVQGPVVSRVKLMANLDITERRVSQDGRFRVRLGKKNIDIRVSTLPTQYGETVVMRLLDPKSAMQDVKEIGLSHEDAGRVLKMIKRPQGMVLVTGPTGSGKTSTLYSMLGHIKSPQINIITLEDPIEYELKDVNQVAVNEKTGLTFAYTLRSVLRQDPDVILVGEMRDEETALIAHQASMTGHLVFTTLHTNDAVSSVMRLKDMGVPQYMIASSLIGIVAQRLVRKICLHCKEAYAPSSDEIKAAGLKAASKTRFYRGAGCKNCGGSGYLGRTGIYEVLTVTPKIKKLISSGAHEDEIRRAAIDAGMVSIQDDGFQKVASGITSFEELTRVASVSDNDDTAESCPACGRSVSAGLELCPHCGHVMARYCRACGRRK